MGSMTIAIEFRQTPEINTQRFNDRLPPAVPRPFRPLRATLVPTDDEPEIEEGSRRGIPLALLEIVDERIGDLSFTLDDLGGGPNLIISAFLDLYPLAGDISITVHASVLDDLWSHRKIARYTVQSSFRRMAPDEIRYGLKPSRRWCPGIWWDYDRSDSVAIRLPALYHWKGKLRACQFFVERGDFFDAVEVLRRRRRLECNHAQLQDYFDRHMEID